jgi:hypothetical protein
MKKDLNIQQRLVVSVLYIGTLLALIFIFTHNFEFLTDGSPYNLIFVSAALLLVFGKYLTEPFFTKPVDTITNLTAILLALLAVKDQSAFIAYDEFLWATVGLLALALISILFSKKSKPGWLDRLQRAVYLTVTTLGSSKWAFSVMYLLVLLSFFTKRPAEFWALLSFFVFVITQFVYEDLVRLASKIWAQLKARGTLTSLLGTAIGKENPFLFKVEVESGKIGSSQLKTGSLVYIQAERNRGFLGVIANEKSLINGTWLTIYLLTSGNRVLCYNFKTQKIEKTSDLFSPNNHVFSLDINELSDEAKKEVKSDSTYEQSSKIVGYVAQGSNINRIKFEILPELANSGILLSEGTVIHTRIHGQNCLYQVVDGLTDEEALEKHDSTGFTIGIAQKLGKYDDTKRELISSRWLPGIYAPVYISDTSKSKFEALSIGALPNTELHLDIKDVHSLVTHNTAILGILGVGKSSLAFELIQKVVNETSSKVVCIDITNEHGKTLSNYLDESLIQLDFVQDKLTALKTSSQKTGARDKPAEWGNTTEYATSLQALLKEFGESDKRVLVLNPDLHAVTKALSQFNITELAELTVAQKTRIISERVFLKAKDGWQADDSKQEAKYLIVYEEAHSLIPEWNSSANDGDQQASNGTAKVIMQGRKYGLGSLVITQRTANISKSILNQCNTIFALRVFDDTGKTFLENYVGSDYANALPILEERHAVVVGKALSLKQPVILQLNNRDKVLKKPAQPKKGKR